MQENQARLLVHVQPNARRNEVVSFEDGALRVKVAAPPVKGKANKELIEFLSETLGIGKSNIAIERGETSKQKLVAITGMDQSQVMKRFLSTR